METKINMQLVEESKKKLTSNNRDDSFKGETSDDKTSCVVDIPNNLEISATNVDFTKHCTGDSSENPNKIANTVIFKKPTVLIGPRRSQPVGKSSRTLTLAFTDDTDNESTENTENTDNRWSQVTKPQEHSKNSSFPYIEPPWSGKPEEDYKMEVLKSGVIVETISLADQNFYVIGRLPSCHVSLAHPTVSRYHAVLQYRSKEDKENSKGFYVYDLESTHGTFFNGNRIKSNIYVRVRGGHMLRFGCSQRKYILQAPLGDQEEESRYTVSELKEMRTLKLEKQRAEEAEVSFKRKENDGIDWGMREDADEETDLQENPYASIADDDLILEDPKKTLRGWFEREGYELQYQIEEKGLGQFLCWINLPMEDIVGRSMRAEALVKGKKKEAVVQCAIEACKMLDRYGLLRQANHEAKKRKTRNWEAEDYYDSDEDNFLDRTGSVERKREQRMRLAGKLEEKVETYDSLLEKHNEVTKRISYLASSIKNWQNQNSKNEETMEEDALDAFMSSLNSFTLTKSDIVKMKLELQSLRKEEASLIKLLNLTRPANLPPLACQTATDKVTREIKVNAKTKIQNPVFHLKRKKKANLETNVSNTSSTSITTFTDGGPEAESEEEIESEEESFELWHSTIATTSATIATTTAITAPAVIIAVTTVVATVTPTITSTVTSATNKCFEENENQEKRRVKVEKKRKQERRKMIVCDQDIYADNYSMWVPPENQLGDGKTSLNEKYGY